MNEEDDLISRFRSLRPVSQTPPRRAGSSHTIDTIEEASAHLEEQQQSRKSKSSDARAMEPSRRVLEKWNRYLQDQSELHDIRILMDELRRVAQIKRKAFTQEIKRFASFCQGGLGKQNLETIRPEEISQASQRISFISAELDDVDTRLDEGDGKILDLESRIRAFLPLVHRPGAEISLDFLLRRGVEFQTSEPSENSDSLYSEEPSLYRPELLRYYAQLNEEEDIENEMRELLDEYNRLVGTPEAELDEESSSFIQNFSSEYSRLDLKRKEAAVKSGRLRDQLELSEQSSGRTR